MFSAQVQFQLLSLFLCARIGTNSVIFRDYAGEIPGIMRAFVVLSIVLAVSAVNAGELNEESKEFCYDSVSKSCKSFSSKTGNDLAECNSTYGGIKHILPDLQTYVNTHITRSFEYLLMATHHNNYQKNRPGFAKVLRGLSDSKWETAHDLIRYIAKRGGSMNFNRRKNIASPVQDPKVKVTLNLNEIEVLAKALDIEKSLQKDAADIHFEAMHNHKYDPEIMHFIQEKFLEPSADTIRKLAGYVIDLKNLLKDTSISLGIHFFDEYLQK